MYIISAILYYLAIIALGIIVIYCSAFFLMVLFSWGIGKNDKKDKIK